MPALADDCPAGLRKPTPHLTSSALAGLLGKRYADLVPSEKSLLLQHYLDAIADRLDEAEIQAQRERISMILAKPLAQLGPRERALIEALFGALNVQRILLERKELEYSNGPLIVATL